MWARARRTASQGVCANSQEPSTAGQYAGPLYVMTASRGRSHEELQPHEPLRILLCSLLRSSGLLRRCAAMSRDAPVRQTPSLPHAPSHCG